MRVPANVAPLVSLLQAEAQLLGKISDADELHHHAVNIARTAQTIAFRVNEAIMAELRSNSPMPEHGFRGSATKAFTVDDL